LKKKVYSVPSSS